jgi:hypothetical protein
MKKYLVTIFGKMYTDETYNQLVMSVAPLVDSPNLKYQFGGGTLLMYFATEIPKDEIFEYIRNLIYGDTEILILTEISDNVSVHMPFKNFGHLFELDKPGDDNTYTIDMKGVIENTGMYDDYDDDDYDDENLPQFITTIKSHLDSITSKPTLDYLLDKINTQGFNSLTIHEKNVLQHYSNN